MKILIIANYIRNKGDHSNIQINGLKKVLGDIYYSPNIIGTNFFLPLSFSSKHLVSCDGLTIIPNNRVQLLRSLDFSFLWYFVSILLKLDKLKNFRKVIGEKLRLNFVIRKIELINPDFIHLHDITSELHSEVIRYCLSKNIPCILTHHIYFGKDSILEEGIKIQPIENKVYSHTDIRKLNITCVSSNLRNRLLNDFPNLSPNNVLTITNGTDFEEKEIKFDVRKLHHIEEEKVIVLCIGRLIIRKNQLAILQTLNKMTINDRKKIVVLFIGESEIDYYKQLVNYSISNNLQESVQFVGSVPITEINNYYAQSDFVIAASINEAFGLTFIEGFVYGLPAITFSDLDAIPDLYDENVMVLAEERSNDSLKEAILTAMDKKWDRDYIKKHAKKFSIDNMVEGYNNLYSRIKKTKI